jgi:hypothetical protein
VIRPFLFLVLAFPLLAASVAASDEVLPVAAQSGPQVGDCAIFSEGGNGRIFRMPTYWLRGTIVSVSRERRTAGRCPQIAKPDSGYKREDWVRIAESTPCVQTDAEVREVDVVRIKLRVDEWETPWSYQHGTPGWLFRGYFLDTLLKKAEVIDMDASWLERCELRK